MAGESFEDMFDTLVREKPDGSATPPPAAKVKEGETQPATPPAAEAAAPAPEAAAPAPEVTEIEPPDPENPEPPPPPENPEPAPPADDPIARLADMLAQRQQTTQQQPQPQPLPQPTPAYSGEELAVLRQYAQDYPDVVKAEALIRRSEYRQLTQHIFQQVAEYLAPQLALLGQVADTTVYGQISQRVPDYDTLHDQVVNWVKTQPGYLQAGMNSVIQQGTVEEIADLFDRYRQATGVTSPNPNPEIAPQAQGGRQTPPPPAKAPELSPLAKQAAQRLAPVSGKRSAPTQAAPATYEDAFEQFAKAIT